MKSERINQDQIRFTIDSNDLIARNLRVSELAYGSQKTQALFDEMMKEAKEKFGMDFSEKAVMIEAIPMSDSTLSITVTKVEGMAELGQLIGTNLPGMGQNQAQNGSDGKTPFGADPGVSFGLGPDQKKEQRPRPMADGQKAPTFEGLTMETGSMGFDEPVTYEFRSLEKLLKVAAQTAEKLQLKNRLLYDDISCYYYLVCEFKTPTPQVRHLISMLVQYCDDWFYGKRPSLVVEEHTKKIVAARALQKLGVVQRSKAE